MKGGRIHNLLHDGGEREDGRGKERRENIFVLFAAQSIHGAPQELNRQSAFLHDNSDHPVSPSFFIPPYLFYSEPNVSSSFLLNPPVKPEEIVVSLPLYNSNPKVPLPYLLSATDEDEMEEMIVGFGATLAFVVFFFFLKTVG